MLMHEGQAAPMAVLKRAPRCGSQGGPGAAERTPCPKACSQPAPRYVHAEHKKKGSTVQDLLSKHSSDTQAAGTIAHDGTPVKRHSLKVPGAEHHLPALSHAGQGSRATMPRTA